MLFWNGRTLSLYLGPQMTNLKARLDGREILLFRQRIIHMVRWLDHFGTLHFFAGLSQGWGCKWLFDPLMAWIHWYHLAQRHARWQFRETKEFVCISFMQSCRIKLESSVRRGESSICCNQQRPDMERSMVEMIFMRPIEHSQNNKKKRCYHLTPSCKIGKYL